MLGVRWSVDHQRDWLTLPIYSMFCPGTIYPKYIPQNIEYSAVLWSFGDNITSFSEIVCIAIRSSQLSYAYKLFWLNRYLPQPTSMDSMSCRTVGGKLYHLDVALGGSTLGFAKYRLSPFALRGPLQKATLTVDVIHGRS